MSRARRAEGRGGGGAHRVPGPLWSQRAHKKGTGGGRWQGSTPNPHLGVLALKAATWESLPLLLPLGYPGPVCTRAMANGPDGAKLGKRRDPQPGAWALPPPVSRLPLPRLPPPLL